MSVDKIFIALIALVMMGSLLALPASAQISYATAPPLYQSGTQLNPNLGICIHVCSAQNFAAAASDGFTWARVDMSWDRIEKTQGQYDWALVDNICTLCKQYHLKPEWVMAYGNTLYGDACTPAGISAYVNFVAAVAARCVANGISGARYEVWNEPENFSWTGTQYNAPGAHVLSSSQIAQINNASVGPVHAADPTALVCTSAFGSFQTEVYWGQPAFAGDPQANPPVPGIDYNGAFDAVALHTYNLGQVYKSPEGASPAGSDRNDNPECLLAYNPANLSADPCPNVLLSMIPKYVPGPKTYWVTEVGRRLDNDCANNQDYFSYEWVRTTLCHWMAGFQWQAHYCLDSDGTYVLKGTKAEQAMTFLTTMTKGRSIAKMSYPSFSGTLPPANAVWSATLSGSPTVQIVWVAEGSASVPVPAGWTATDMYGDSLSSKIANGTLPMQESSGVCYEIAPAPSLSRFTLTPTSVPAGQTSLAKITLAATASTGGATIALKSSDTSSATVPASVTIAAGNKSISFHVTTLHATSTKTVTITATSGSSVKTATLTITPTGVTVTSLTLSPTSVKGGGATSTGTITLSGPAPSGGLAVKQTSSDTSAAMLSPTLNIAAGVTSAKFKITSYAVSSTKSVTITSSVNGASKTVTLAIMH